MANPSRRVTISEGERDRGRKAEERVSELTKQRDEQGKELVGLQKQLDDTRAAALVELSEVRKSLADSEESRAKVSDQLQAERDKYAATVELARSGIVHQSNQFAEMFEAGLLNDTAQDRFKAMQKWLTDNP